MLSSTIKSHWRLVIRMIKKAIRLTIDEIIRNIKLRLALKKKTKDMELKRRLYITLDRLTDDKS
ncbi:MAG: hypothetical protein NZM09_10170 [Ignavibacterium sp.]|nr:hypothetical protein [Ignavibacterium sp.]MDW8376044.1 hypothetical protein [Ignavibacteriales bacterium]